MAQQWLFSRPDPFRRDPSLKEHRVRKARVLSRGWHVAYTHDRIMINWRVSHKKGLIDAAARVNGGKVRVEVPDPIAAVAGQAVLIGGHDNYYHHLVDYIANMAYWERNPSLRDLPIIVAEPTQRFQQQMFERLQIREDRLIYVPAHAAILCKQLVMLPYAFGKLSRVLDPTVFDWLQYRFAPKRSSTGRRLYISRQRAGSRRLRNGEELSAILAKHGFEEVFLEDLAFSEQIDLFASASVVIGAHGAGLTNILFARPGATIVEFLPGDIKAAAALCFSSLSKPRGLKHIFLRGSAGYRAAEFEISPKALNDVLATLD